MTTVHNPSGPNPTTITAAPDTPYLEVVRDFDAPRALLFRATVDPDLVVQWLGPRNRRTELETWEPRTGGAYRYAVTGDEGFTAGFRGVFHTVRDGELVVQTSEFEGAPDEVCLEFATYTDLGEGRSRMRTRSVFPSAEARDMALQTGMTDGIHDSMDRLVEVLGALC
jgi:uncharacterized protein YndB with AHSA1/START domain